MMRMSSFRKRRASVAASTAGDEPACEMLGSMSSFLVGGVDGVEELVCSLSADTEPSMEVFILLLQYVVN
jgi:hypothetical protein